MTKTAAKPITKADIRETISVLRKEVNVLKKQREKLDKQVAKTAGELGIWEQFIGKPKPRSGRGRAIGPSLNALIPVVLKEAVKPMGISELLQACEDKGWASKSAKPTNIIQQALLRLVKAKEITYPARGKYAAKQAPKKTKLKKKKTKPIVKKSAPKQ